MVVINIFRTKKFPFYEKMLITISRKSLYQKLSYKKALLLDRRHMYTLFLFETILLDVVLYSGLKVAICTHAFAGAL